LQAIIDILTSPTTPLHSKLEGLLLKQECVSPHPTFRDTESLTYSGPRLAFVHVIQTATQNQPFILHMRVSISASMLLVALLVSVATLVRYLSTENGTHLGN
jgi:hypothetical protein